MCVRVLRSTKIGHFYTKNTIFNFFRKLHFWLIWLVFLTLGSILGPQICSNWPHHRASIGQGHPKEIFGPWCWGGLRTQAGATGQNVRFSKISTFGSIFSWLLRAQLNSSVSCGIPTWIYAWDFKIFELSPRRKTLGLRRPKSGVGYISPEPQDSSKI